jgi:hypothetical protein
MQAVQQQPHESSVARAAFTLFAGAVALAAGIGIGVMVSKPAAAATVGPPGANPLFTTPITDAGTVKQYQTLIATAIATATATGATAIGPWSPTAAASQPYPTTSVDGNPANPAFMADLAQFQVWMNAQQPWSYVFPAGFPAALRTDGVLDYATAMAIVNGLG